ncbi:MAG: MarR family winged helix-turn-helix transcriptional regulator [Terriglobales bacterium]
MQGKKRQLSGREELADRMHSAAIHLLRRVRKRDAAMAQAPARLSALSVLVFSGSMTMGGLASAEHVKPPTMSRIIAGLERDRLVKRVPDAKDGRRVQLSATPKGTKLMLLGRHRRIAYLANHLKTLTRTEMKTLGDSLAIVERVLHTWK